MPTDLNSIIIKSRVKYDKHCLKQNEVTFAHKQIVNLWSYTQYANFTLANSQFGAITLVENAGPNKYSYSGHRIRFDAYRRFSLSDCSEFGKNVMLFGAEIISAS